MQETIGFIGIGVMGTPICVRLLDAGYNVVVYHPMPGRTDFLEGRGAVSASTPADLAASSAKVITMLRYSKTVEEVLIGQSGVIEGIRPGSIVIDMGSSDPDSTRRLAGVLGEKQVEMLDAPVAGGPEGSKNGTLTIMVGGTHVGFQKCEALLHVLGSKIHHIGPVGLGHTIKTVNNLMLAVNLLGVCEGLVLGVKAGIPAKKLFEVIADSSGSSYALTNRAAPHILADDFQPPSLDNLAKDIGIATDLGREIRVPLVAGNLVHQILITAQERGMSHMDDTCIVKLLEEAAGIRVQADVA